MENGIAVEEPTRYSVVDANKIYSGEIQVGITFTAKVTLDVSVFCYILIYFTFLRPYFRLSYNEDIWFNHSCIVQI